MAASEGRERGVPRRVRAGGGRDVVLAVGLAAVVLGGTALCFRTAWAADVHAPVMPLFALLVLGVGVAMARWSVAPVRGRARGRGGGTGGAGGSGGRGARRGGVRRRGPDACGAPPEGPSVRGEEPPFGGAPFAEGVVVDGTMVEVVEPPVAEGTVVDGPVVDGEALDHVGADPDGFEHTVAALCVRDGCAAVEVVGGAGDLGADILATTADGRRVVLQCKRYAADHRVGSPDLQRFGGTCYTVHEADVAVVVTTSSFTEPALAYAESCGIVCVDGPALDAWTASAAPAPWQLLPAEADAASE